MQQAASTAETLGGPGLSAATPAGKGHLAAAVPPGGRAVVRVRHEMRLRLLTVLQAERVSARLVRVRVGGEQLQGFASPGFDDHVKVFFPPPGEAFTSLPELGTAGPVFADGVTRPAMRDYTPHHHDPEALSLQFDFALHGTGPATEWAARAQAGDTLMVGGPRGSFLVGTGFDHHLLIGDETALPAIRRRIAELPPGADATILAEVDGPANAEPFRSAANVETRWVYRSGVHQGSASCLAEALQDQQLPTGSYHAWVACESSDAKALRVALLARGVGRASLRAAGYWRRGAAASHDVLD